MALLQAGLAIMSGESPNALKNIGAGAMQGLAAYKDEIKMLKAAAERKREGLELIEEARRQQAANNLAEARAFDAQGREAMLNAQRLQQEALTRGLGTELGIRANLALGNMQAESAMARATYGAGVTRSLYKMQADERNQKIKALASNLTTTQNNLRSLRAQRAAEYNPEKQRILDAQIAKQEDLLRAYQTQQGIYGGVSPGAGDYTPSYGAGLPQGFSVEPISE